MTNLQLAVIQADLAWENPEKNRTYFQSLFQDIASQNIDLVILPETFTTGFSMNSKNIAESPKGETVQWMQTCAKEYNFLLTGSLAISENNKYFNRQYFAFPDGSTQHYDKRHLFRMGGEDEQYTAGKDRIIINYKGWRILPQICYDLRFPIWSRNRNDYDLLLYIANFPQARQHLWQTLLAARAMENQCYVVGCNRIGTDAEGLNYSGDSQILSPKGELLALASPNTSCVLTHSLSLAQLNNFRQKFPVHLDADKFAVQE